LAHDDADARRHGRAQRRHPADHRDRDRDGLVSIVLFIVLGSVLEGIPAMVLFGPLLFPVAKAAGINEVHYAIVAVLAMGIGLFSPPLGVGFFSASAIGKSDPEHVVKAILPYLAALLVALLIIAFVPWISLGFLPATAP
jgi:TRAP-type C4-dicarboxylate transport system permease large subunit